MEEGPPPMRNLRPSQKNPTAANKFHEDHQTEYEKYTESTDPYDRVQRHNEAYPKMRDELDRRRSAAEATAIKDKRNGCYARRSTVYDPNCKQCVKERKAKEARRHRQSYNIKTSFGKRSKITKNKSNHAKNRTKIVNTRHQNNNTFEHRQYVRLKKSVSLTNYSKENTKFKHIPVNDKVMSWVYFKNITTNKFFRPLTLRNTFNNNSLESKYVIDPIGSDNRKDTTKYENDSARINKSNSCNENGSAENTNAVSKSELSSGSYPDTSFFSIISHNSMMVTDDELMAEK